MNSVPHRIAVNYENRLCPLLGIRRHLKHLQHPRVVRDGVVNRCSRRDVCLHQPCQVIHMKKLLQVKQNRGRTAAALCGGNRLLSDMPVPASASFQHVMHEEHMETCSHIMVRQGEVVGWHTFIADKMFSAAVNLSSLTAGGSNLYRVSLKKPAAPLERCSRR